MPELPEVEVVRLGLADHVVRRRISAVVVEHPRPVRTHPEGPTGFVRDLTGREISAVRRRGKYLWLVLDDDALIVHLGMSGQFRINQPEDPLARNTRVRFLLDDGRELRFVDQRMFGGLEWAPGKAECPVPHIALDPFDPSFELAAVVERMRSKRTTVKRALLDQRLVSGIGNIYADEALWRSKLHFELSTQELTQRQGVTLIGAAHDVMAAALAQGGTSFDSLYVNINGQSGYFSRSLEAYGREDQPCTRCGTPIVRRSFMNRSSYFCPRCQRAPKGIPSA